MKCLTELSYYLAKGLQYGFISQIILYNHSQNDIFLLVEFILIQKDSITFMSKKPIKNDNSSIEKKFGKKFGNNMESNLRIFWERILFFFLIVHTNMLKKHCQDNSYKRKKKIMS